MKNQILQETPWPENIPEEDDDLKLWPSFMAYDD